MSHYRKWYRFNVIDIPHVTRCNRFNAMHTAMRSYYISRISLRAVVELWMSKSSLYYSFIFSIKLYINIYTHFFNTIAYLYLTSFIYHLCTNKTILKKILHNEYPLRNIIDATATKLQLSPRICTMRCCNQINSLRPVWSYSHH